MTSKVEGKKLRALMAKYELSGDEGSDVVAEMLYVKRSAVQAYYTRGLPIVHFELLTRKLKEKYGK